MRRTPTDLELLDEIYERYYDVFTRHSRDAPIREAKIYVPIDCATIAKKLGVDPDIVFGRLYYDLDKRYGYAQSDGSKVNFFAPVVGKDQHCIHFPLLCSVLAGLRYEKKRYLVTTWIALAALMLSSLSLGVAMYGTLVNHY